MSITLPISFEVVSMRGAAAAVTSTVSAKAPMLRVAEISVVFVACTITVSKTCALNPSFDTLNLYVPSGRLTNAYVPVAWVSAVIALLVPKLRSSKCAPGTILPLGSRTVTVTVPSVCCAHAQGRAINRTAKRHEAKRIRIEDTRDIRLPPANEVQHTKQTVRPPISTSSGNTREGHTSRFPAENTTGNVFSWLDFVYFIRSGCQDISCQNLCDFRPPSG